MDPKNAFFIASYDFPSYYDFIHKRKKIENIFLCLKTAILGPKNRKTGIQIMRTGKGFKKSLFVFLHLEHNIRVLCVLDFRNSPLISLITLITLITLLW